MGKVNDLEIKEGNVDDTIVKPGELVWTPKSWKVFWANPSPEIARTRIPLVVSSDVHAYWPSLDTRLEGVDSYRDYVMCALELFPDIHVELVNYGKDGATYFMHWRGSVTYKGEALKIAGVDCITLEKGLVSENCIYSDSPIFANIAERYKSKQ